MIGWLIDLWLTVSSNQFSFPENIKPGKAIALPGEAGPLIMDKSFPPAFMLSLTLHLLL